MKKILIFTLFFNFFWKSLSGNGIGNSELNMPNVPQQIDTSPGGYYQKQYSVIMKNFEKKCENEQILMKFHVFF